MSVPHAEHAERPQKQSGGLAIESWLFLMLAGFFFAAAIIYGFWSREPAGTVALILTGGLALIVGSFLWFTSRRLEGPRPEDDLNAEVADGAGDLGFFSPGSYWPFALAAAAALTAIALAFWLVWLIVIGIGFLLLTIMCLLFEYQRGYASH